MFITLYLYGKLWTTIWFALLQLEESEIDVAQSGGKNTWIITWEIKLTSYRRKQYVV